MTRMLGADGVRGLANELPTPELVVQLGQAAVRVLTKDIPASQPSRTSRPRAIVGRNTRAPGEFPDHTISADFVSSDVDVTHVDVLPTPAITHLTVTQSIDLGIVIFASHNPFRDSDIKFFGRGGYKLDDALEDQIEALLSKVKQLPTGAAMGRVIKGETIVDQSYVSHLVDSVGTNPSGLRIVVNTPNGATSHVGPAVLRTAGAEVVIINASPDGLNINVYCGLTRPEQLQKYVVAVHADMGVAYDDNADRCLVVDVEGKLIDDDQIMGLLAMGMRVSGTLGSDTLVTTVMSNLGLSLAMKEHDIHIVQAGVDDRYILERMLQGDYTPGGEQSGHIINTIHVTTGDGTPISLRIAARMKHVGKSLAELASTVQRLPQALVNARDVDKVCAGTNVAMQEAVEEAEAELSKSERVLLHPSGTEPFVRVTAKAMTQEQASEVAGRLTEVIKDNLVL